MGLFSDYNTWSYAIRIAGADGEALRKLRSQYQDATSLPLESKVIPWSSEAPSGEMVIPLLPELGIDTLQAQLLKQGIPPASLEILISVHLENDTGFKWLPAYVTAAMRALKCSVAVDIA